MKKQNRIARKGDTAHTRAQAKRPAGEPLAAGSSKAPRTDAAETLARNLGLPKARGAKLRALCEQEKITPEQFAATALDWWLLHADADPGCVFAQVRLHDGGRSRRTDQTSIDANAAQIFAKAFRDIMNDADPCRRQTMLAGLHYLCLWNPFLKTESDALREIIVAQAVLADSGALHIADEAEEPGSWLDTRALRERWTVADDDAAFRDRQARLGPIVVPR